MRQNRLLVAAIAALTASCTIPLPPRIDFAVSEETVYVPATGGDATINIYTDGEVILTPEKTPEWGTVETPLSISSDAALTMRFSENNGLRRSVNVKLSYKGGLSEKIVRFLQEGIEAKLTVGEHSLFVDSREEKSTDLAIETNIDPADITVSTEYLGSENGWISKMDLQSDRLIINTPVSPSENVRKALVTLSHIDGWGKLLRETVSINLSNSDGAFGKVISYADLRSLGTVEGATVTDDVILKGVIVSDCSSKNMEMNPNTAIGVVDTTPSDATAYIESEDGSLGFRLAFNLPEENTLQQKRIAEILLNGKTIIKEQAPERYTIRGLRISDFNLVGTADALPSKTKKISELSDTDVYTFVEIPSTEFLNKDGCYSNVYETYTLPSSFNVATVSNDLHTDCWPAMLVDNEGRTIYAMVNMMCEWRRKGNGVPKGTGPLKGILVHNEQPRYGDLGRYQIRVVDESGYAQSTSAASAYTVLMKWDGKPYKYNFANFGTSFPYNNDHPMDSVIPSDDIVKSTGKCSGTLSFENKLSEEASGTKALRPCNTFNALKTSGSPGAGQVENRGLSIQCNAGGWYNWNEDKSLKSINGIVISFSTTSVSGKKVYLYFSFCAGGTDARAFKNYPARWCVEYSTDEGLNYTAVNAVESGKPYVHLRNFGHAASLAIDGKYYNPSYSTGMGFTEHFYEFPDDIAGKANVKVRIRPYDTTLATLPDNPAEDIEKVTAYPGFSSFEDLRIDRINIITK